MGQIRDASKTCTVKCLQKQGWGNTDLGYQIETEYLWKNSLLKNIISNIHFFAVQSYKVYSVEGYIFGQDAKFAALSQTFRQ